MSEALIRKSKMTDAELLGEVFVRAIRNDFGYYPSGAKKEFLKIWDAKFFRKRRPITFIAVLKEKIVGFVIGNPQWQNSGVGSIDWLWVEKSSRCRGIASELLLAIENYFGDLGHHKLILNADNKTSQEFYPKVGYRLEGEMRNHFWHLDEKRYAKDLGK